MRPQRRPDGFSLIEVLTSIVIAGILLATVSMSFARYLRSTQQSNTATEIRAELRNAAERSLSEGRTYCVYFNTAARTYATYRSDCTVSANRVTLARPGSTLVTVSAVNFTPPSPAVPNQASSCPTLNACAYFYPRGNGVPGSVTITRSGSSKIYTVSVEGLTSRVSIA
ncbi:MAG: prepilin-type N-terminal cleavage/methylation domain-containing protein [Actinomycetota bacterium]|nr:prepilin-type N-terminal cleavage/methylation domain-containing protein [Actinomycetota bacterium]